MKRRASLIDYFRRDRKGDLKAGLLWLNKNLPINPVVAFSTFCVSLLSQIVVVFWVMFFFFLSLSWGKCYLLSTVAVKVHMLTAWTSTTPLPIVLSLPLKTKGNPPKDILGQKQNKSDSSPPPPPHFKYMSCLISRGEKTKHSSGQTSFSQQHLQQTLI